VACLTEDEYKGNVCVILAGYESPIHDLLRANPGLAGRFKGVLHFRDWSPEVCLR
jgi:hypothetical protein